MPSQHIPTLTPQHQANYDVKGRLLAALGKGDWDAAGDLLHPDFELREPERLPYGGVYKGAEGFRKCLGLIPQAQTSTRFETLHTYFTSDPDRIFSESEWAGTLKKSGRQAATKVSELFEFRDGKVLAITVIWFNIPDYG